MTQALPDFLPASARVRQFLHRPPCILDEDTPLLQLSDLPMDDWTLRDAFEGVQVFGATGSGKSSGSGRALAHAFLQGGMGGLVLCAKEDEADTWQRYAEETGRERDVIRFTTDDAHAFNFLEYELRRDPSNADVTITNVVNLLLNILEVASRGTSLTAATGGGDAFWMKSAKMMLGHAVRLLYAAYGTLRLPQIIELLESAPRVPGEHTSPEFQKRSFFAATIREIVATGGGRFPPSPEDEAQMLHFWFTAFPAIPEKTRGNILTTIRADIDPLLSGRMRRLFCEHTTLVPEFTHDGAIILLDFPVKRLGDAGILAQQIFKYAWQRSTEARRADAQSRPVFLFADECQFFLTGYDMEFQSTARSSRTCTVLMTQNLPTFYSRMGGQSPEHTVNAMLGNLRTLIFHTNTDQATNEWASRLVGKQTVWRQSFSQNTGWSEGRSGGTSSGYSDGWNTSISRDGGFSSGSSGGYNQGRNDGYNTGSSGGQSSSMNEQREYAVEPEDFNRDLKSGGRRHDYIVTGVVMQAGRIFVRNRKHWMQVAFRQR